MSAPIRERPLFGHGIVRWEATQLCGGGWRWDGLDADGQNIVMVDDTEDMERFLETKTAPSVHPWYYDQSLDFAALVWA